MVDRNFFKTTLPLIENLFKDLSNSVEFENVGKGRKGNHLVNVGENGVPIVRTTTRYTIPAHNFSATHHELVNCINSTINNSDLSKQPQLNFNNALIEIYDSNYKKMNFHSDQCLDLEPNSYIGLFSCYEKPEELTEQNIRLLIVKDKLLDEEIKIPLTQNSVILFSVKTNLNFNHKIVLNTGTNSKYLPIENKWLGITFRKSKTFIKFKNDLPYFENGKMLVLANEEQKAQFFQLRGQENSTLDFVYPDLIYTLSDADLMKPKNCFKV